MAHRRDFEMANKSGKTKSGDTVKLYIGEEDMQSVVLWYDLCGYDEVTLRFAFPSEAEAFFNAVLKVTEVEED
jgi:hypothetical protein